jgi:hypothetical protein
VQGAHAVKARVGEHSVCGMALHRSRRVNVLAGFSGMKFAAVMR